ncbi:NACHT N-terminal Helical domain 1-containing protein [Streptomyces sp. NPDC001665]
MKELFLTGGPGAGLVDRPVRLTDHVSFRGERRSIGDEEVRRPAARQVQAALTSPGEPPFPPDGEAAVAGVLADRLIALGVRAALGRPGRFLAASAARRTSHVAPVRCPSRSVFSVPAFSPPPTPG